MDITSKRFVTHLKARSVRNFPVFRTAYQLEDC